MALWGVTGSDVKNFGWNTAVGLGVAVGCGAVSWGVKKAANVGYAYFNKEKATAKEKEGFSKGYATWGGVAAGLGAAVLANAYLPARFALVSDFSTGTMFKVGVVAAVGGAILDYVAKTAFMPFAALGALGAVASRYSAYAPAGFGLFGAAFGSGAMNFFNKPSHYI
jgi:hypothetical protein